MKADSSVVLIGDVVRSRNSRSRADLHLALTLALDAVNASNRSDLRITVGDEYQGTFPSLGAALAATVQLRCDLLPAHDVRHGVGHGRVEVLDNSSRIEDGPGWWVAREAINEAKRLEGKAATRSVRTVFRSASPEESELSGAVNAALMARDHLIGSLDARGMSVLRGMLQGRSQRSLATELEISPSAVAQRVRRDGIGVVVAMVNEMKEL